MMKKIVYAALVAAAFASCNTNNGKSDDMQYQIDSLQHIIDGRDAELNDLMGIVSDVQEGIRCINEAEQRVTVAEGNAERANQREIIRENMQYIQDAMAQNRQTISKLQEKLKASSIHSDKLQKTIAQLQAQIEQQGARLQELEASLAEKNIVIASQGVQIDSLTNDVQNLTAESAAKQQTLDQQDKDLHKAWFVFGTKTELKTQKILKDGEVLRDGSFNQDYFTEIDIRYDKVVRFYSKSAKILTSHPADSYQLVRDAQKQYELHIVNPDKFWSVSKYLVVLVK